MLYIFMPLESAIVMHDESWLKFRYNIPSEDFGLCSGIAGTERQRTPTHEHLCCSSFVRGCDS